MAKEEGGLGIKYLKNWNKALMAKHLWDICAEKDSLWIKWSHENILKERSIWNSATVSWTWRKLLKLRDNFIDVIQYKAGNGETISLWWDFWHSLGPLTNRYGRRVIHDAALTEKATVKDVISNNSWRWPNPNAESIAHIIRNTHVQFLPRKNEQDTVIWLGSNTKSYNTRSAWEHIRRRKDRVTWWKIVWFKGHIPKCAFIQWLICWKRLNTKEKLKNLGIINEDTCCLCQQEVETLPHIFFKCSYSLNIWRVVQRRNNIGEDINGMGGYFGAVNFLMDRYWTNNLDQKTGFEYSVVLYMEKKECKDLQT